MKIVAGCSPKNRKGRGRGVLTFWAAHLYPKPTLSGLLYWFSLPTFPPHLPFTSSLSTPTPPPLFFKGIFNNYAMNQKAVVDLGEGIIL